MISPIGSTQSAWRRGRVRAAAVLSACVLLAAVGVRAGRARADTAPLTIPAQRFDAAPEGETAALRTDHFDVRYLPTRLSRELAEEAARLADGGWVHCERLFGGAPPGRVTLDLTPRFVGATGFTRSGDPRAREEKDRPLIGVRYTDLDYLGLSGEYVLTHEIGHVFSGEVAGSSLGEGIADWSAGTFSRLPMRPGWGTALRGGGLWIDPDAFFITGDFLSNPEVDSLIRTAQYAETGLLVEYLVHRYGWEKTRAFADIYGKLRGRLDSNEDRRRQPPTRRGRSGPDVRDPRLAPDAAQVRACFERTLGNSWESLRADWERRMSADPVPEGEAERLVLAHRIYGSIRNYEMWLVVQRAAPGADAQARVRQAFTEANRALGKGDLPTARTALEEARSMVEQLRRPRSIAGNYRPGMRIGAAAQIRRNDSIRLRVTFETTGAASGDSG